MSDSKKELSLEEILLKALWDYNDLDRLGYGCKTSIWKKVKLGQFEPPIDYDGQPRWIPARVRKRVEEKPNYNFVQPDQLKKHQEQQYTIG